MIAIRPKTQGGIIKLIGSNNLSSIHPDQEVSFLLNFSNLCIARGGGERRGLKLTRITIPLVLTERADYVMLCDIAKAMRRYFWTCRPCNKLHQIELLPVRSPSRREIFAVRQFSQSLCFSTDYLLPHFHSREKWEHLLFPSLKLYRTLTQLSQIR